MRFLVPGVVAIAVGVLWIGSQAAAAPDRPNILWLSCEDISPHLGCYGDPHAVTPNLDRLAGRSLDRHSWRWVSKSSLKVWKNSS